MAIVGNLDRLEVAQELGKVLEVPPVVIDVLRWSIDSDGLGHLHCVVPPHSFHRFGTAVLETARPTLYQVDYSIAEMMERSSCIAAR